MRVLSRTLLLCELISIIFLPSMAWTFNLRRFRPDHYLPQLFPHDHTATAEATKAELNAQNRLLNVDGFGCSWYTVRKAVLGLKELFAFSSRLLVTAEIVFFSSMQKSFSEFQQSEDADLPRPVFYKTTQPPANDPYLHSIARGTASNCVFAHIRCAALQCRKLCFSRHRLPIPDTRLQLPLRQ